MRIACLVSVLLAAVACGDAPSRSVPGAAPPPPTASQPRPAPSSPAIVAARNENGRTRIEFDVDDKRAFVVVERDGRVPPEAEPWKVDVVAALPGRALVLIDRYRSKPGGLSLCQAGEEQFLRVISRVPGAPNAEAATVTYSTKVASCRDNIELADPGVEWEGPASTLRIHWLTAPSGAAAERSLTIDATGHVAVR